MKVGGAVAKVTLVEDDAPSTPLPPDLVPPDVQVQVEGFENPTDPPSTVSRLAPQHGFELRERMAETVGWLTQLGGRALTIAAALWTCSCATTTTKQGPRRSASLPPPPSEKMSQLAYPDTWLGHGERRTIAEAGCFLTALAMASEAMTNKDWDPVTANNAVKKGGGFSGPALDLPDAARALGLRVKWRGAVTTSTQTKHHAALDRHLAAKQVAVASVDFRSGASSGESEGDHFLMVYAKRGDAYFGVDPLGGRIVELKTGPDGFLSYGDDPRFRVCELCLLSPGM